jgi:DNA-binding NarL/FixJ family response regulator
MGLAWIKIPQIMESVFKIFIKEPSYRMPKSPLIQPQTVQVLSLKFLMKTKTIIIDDHSLFNDGMNSRQARTKCFSLKPELVIVDYNMPHINGLEVVRQLNTLGSDTKIVIVSMYADKKEIELFKKEGVNAYITKTTPGTELIESLKKVMEGERIFESKNKAKTVIVKDAFANKNQLTKREMDILRLIKQEKTTEKIAETLNLSFYTVETHRKNINHKLKFKTKKKSYAFLETIGE